jgi:hypothetical protein
VKTSAGGEAKKKGQQLGKLQWQQAQTKQEHLHGR